MSDYDFILDDFTWSFSRLQNYKQCPLSFYHTYLMKKETTSGFFSEYGSFLHNILEKYYKNELMYFEMEDEYVNNFTKNIIAEAPPNKYIDLVVKYYDQGLDYIKNFQEVEEEVFGIEKKYDFKIGDYNFTGVIDLELQDKDGNVIVLDHKSKSAVHKVKYEDGYVKLIDGRYIPFEMAMQLYLYSIPLKEKHGKYPKYLAWNMFRINDFYKLEFKEEDLQRSVDWVLATIKEIYNEVEWLKGKNITSFFCDFLCSVNYHCEFSAKYMNLGD